MTKVKLANGRCIIESEIIAAVIAARENGLSEFYIQDHKVRIVSVIEDRDDEIIIIETQEEK